MKRKTLLFSIKAIKKTVFTVILLLSNFALSAQNGSIKGKVIDAANDEPLIGASVTVSGTTTGGATDFDGNYSIPNLAPGTYSLTISYISYKTQTKADVRVEPGKETVVDIALESADISLGEVEVVAKANRESENILLMEQREAVLATQAVGAKEMSRKGVSDAEGAVAQISGILKQEGVKNVFVRGLGDRYNATMLNGFPIPSEDPEYKNIALDFFGTDIIQSVGVNKVFTSGYIGDVGGAMIDIVSKELIKDRSFKFDVSSGVNSSAIGTDFIRQDGSNYFGFANTKQPASGSYEFSNSLDPSKVSFPLNHSYGLSGGRLFEIGENSNPLSFFLVASYATDFSYTEELVKNTVYDGTIFQDQTGGKYSQSTNQLVLSNLHYGINRRHNVNYDFMLVHVNDQYIGQYSGMNTEKHQDVENHGSNGIVKRQQTNDNILLVNQVMTDWQLTDPLKVTVGASYNTIKGLEPDRRENYFSLREDGYYNLTKSNRNKRFFSDLKNSDVNAKTIFTYKLGDRFGSENSLLQAGYLGRFVRDEFNAIEYNFSPNTPPLSKEDLSNLNTIFVNGLNDGTITMAKGDLNMYKVTKNIHSGFAGLSYQVLKNMIADVGVQMDIVDLSVVYRVPNEGNESISKNYFLPSLNLKYDFSDKHAIRLGASKTYTLPQSKEIAPYQYVNISFASEGNPDIKPSDNYNIDLKWDFYISNSELFSITGFYKYISNPIGRVDEGNSAGLLTYSNISNYANVGGVELELRKNIFNRFSTAQEHINRLSVGLNASYIYTNLLLNIDNTESRNTGLEGASPLLVNTDVSYMFSKREKSWVASLIFKYFSDRIHTIGTKGYRDIMEEGVPTLDFATSYSFNRNLSIKLKAVNLLDASYKLSRESSTVSDRVVLNEFKKGRNISLGFSYEF